MIGLCNLILWDPSGKTPLNIDSYLDVAVISYTESRNVLFGVRSAMLYYEMLKYRSQYREAAQILIRSNSDV